MSSYITKLWLLPGGTGIGIRKVDGTEVEFTADQVAAALDGIGTADIADGAVTAGKLATDAVETAKIKNSQVTATKLATDAVETAKIKDDAVTKAKVAADVAGTGLAQHTDGSLKVDAAANVAAIADTGSATAADVAGKVNAILTALKAKGLMVADS